MGNLPVRGRILINVLITIILQQTVVINCLNIGRSVNLSHVQKREADGVAWTHNANFSNGLTLRWSSADPVWLTMEMSAVTTGYVAVGFSPSGGMTGADIVMGWVDDKGKGYIKDLHGIGNTTPVEDVIQDYELLSFSEANGRTTIVFRRKWNTCDSPNDLTIDEPDSFRLIYAYNNEDPAYLDGKFKPKYHAGVETRGLSRTYMRIPITNIKFPDDNLLESKSANDVKFWDVGLDTNLVEGEDDVLFCKIVRIPDVQHKHHMIGFKPIVQEENKHNIHHIVLYECIVPKTADPEGLGTAGVLDKYAEKPCVRCQVPSTPPEWGHCNHILVMWTSGSEGNMYPAKMGFPLGEEYGGSTYFKFEIHYENPTYRTIKDTSGLRIFYTDNLREFDGATLGIGHKVSPFAAVPPSMEAFTAKAVCTAECTGQTIPETGITAVAVLLHGHTTTRKITLQIIRNGIELEPLAEDFHYDYNYQQSRVLTPHRVILPGDVLITTCEYNTSKRDFPSYGGLGTRDEMCMAYVHYYPKIALADCKTQPEFHSFLSALGVTKVRGKILQEMNMPYKPESNSLMEYPDNPFYLKNSTYKTPLNAFDAMLLVEGISPDVKKYATVDDLIRGLNWKDANIGKAIEKKWLNGKHYSFCTGDRGKRFPLKEYIVKIPDSYTKYEKPKQSSCPTV